MSVFRCYTEKRKGFDVEAQAVFRDVRDFLGITGVDSVRVLCRYDVEGISGDVYVSAKDTVFSEPQVDDIYDESYPQPEGAFRALAVEALPGQFDQRADSCAQCIELLARGARPAVRTAKLFIFSGDIGEADLTALRGYLINPVESREADEDKPDTLAAEYAKPAEVETLAGFIYAGSDDLESYIERFGLAMDLADLQSMQSYFRDTEKRDPTIAELRVLDTYWSDHCRHTTFNTHITDASIDDPAVQRAYGAYLSARREVYGGGAETRAVTLMDIATIAAKCLRRRGLLAELDISEEVNACSIHVGAVVDGKTEDWLLMFKNETHNHPTEVEPFGGAATCLGGAIRDPLAGRAFVYQAMRVTGSGDPRAAVSDTVPGKLPQRKLTQTAARGYSSYGNQIGLAAGLVHEIYHPGYIAKRMELGAVVGAVRASDVAREAPAPGDKVILLGGRTGRDGIGGATGSSKTHTAGSRAAMASEVQKGNAPEERKIQRLFLDPEVTGMIKRCNDFGAGGISVAVGELADGLDIDLSLIRRKYEGLDGTELAISESQERMAVVVAPGDTDTFIKKAEDENLEAYVIAEVTVSPRMVMRHEGKVIVDISREFLDTNGAIKHTSVYVPPSPLNPVPYLLTPARLQRAAPDPCTLTTLVSDLRFCSQRGLFEMFDGSVGASSILMKNGGRTQSTPPQVMASLLPVGFYSAQSNTSTCSVMSFGFDPYLSSKDPFTGAKAAVVTSVAKLVAAGCDPDKVYLSFQEYYERLRSDPARWGKPFAALLGAFEAQMELELAAIGGKDSMSGSFDEMDVPPTLVSFAIAPNDASRIITPEFKNSGHDVVVFMPAEDLKSQKEMWRGFHKLITDKLIVSAWAVTEGGGGEAVFKMAIGNEIGFEYAAGFSPELLFAKDAANMHSNAATDTADAAETANKHIRGFSHEPLSVKDAASTHVGAIIAEIVYPTAGTAPGENTAGSIAVFGHDEAAESKYTSGALLIGRTIAEPVIKNGSESVSLAELKSAWEGTLESVFPTSVPLYADDSSSRDDSANGTVKDNDSGAVQQISFPSRSAIVTRESFAKPRALIFAFPGTNSEIDTARAVSRAGGEPRIIVIKNLTPAALDRSLADAARAIGESQILIIPGGFSFGDEPDGSAKFITVFFRNPALTDKVHEHLKARDGLMLGICNGFQALIKLGLVPFGEVSPPSPLSPTLTHNRIGRHHAGYVFTRVASVNSPWMSLCNAGDIHCLPVSHGEGRFVASGDVLGRLAANGQIATQYSDANGAPSMLSSVNPNGSDWAVEGLFSPDGRVFGKMAHTERSGKFVAQNIYGEKHQPVFESGIHYFK